MARGNYNLGTGYVSGVAAALSVLGAAGGGSNQQVGTTSAASRSQTMARKRRKVTGRRSSFAKKVRNLAPYQHNTLADGSDFSNMTHNTIYTTNLTAKIVQGDANTDRDGDAIYLNALKLSGAIHTNTASNGYMFRVLVGWSGEEYAITASSAGLTSQEIFLPATGTTFLTNGIVNPKAFTCIYDSISDVNSLLATTADIFSLRAKIQLDQKYVYQSSGSTFGKFKNLYLVVIGCVIGGTTGTTATGTFYMGTDVIFQKA